MQYIYHFHHWQTPREPERTAWASLLKAGRTPGHYRPYFSRIKKNAVDPRRANVFPVFASPFPLKNGFWSFPHRSGDGRGEDSNVELLPSEFSLSADISPPPLSEILFLHRFEQEEVGRWSRQKRQACGPLTTSCSLFCDPKTVPTSVLRAALSPVRHTRRRNAVFQVWIAPEKSVGQGKKIITGIQKTSKKCCCVNFWKPFSLSCNSYKILGCVSLTRPAAGSGTGS